MSSGLKSIKLWGARGPNAPKIAILLKELGLPHEAQNVQFADLKKPEFLAINPNGRVPAIYDANTDLTLWESGAITEYLIDKYDSNNKLSFPKGSNNDYLTKQWLYYQVSGQGPYYGQAYWFHTYHAEDVPSAKERYVNEALRVTDVLEGHLAKQKEGPWLVGNKVTYADLSFITWQSVLPHLVKDYNPDDHPNVKKWLENIQARKGVQDGLATEFS